MRDLIEKIEQAITSRAGKTLPPEDLDKIVALTKSIAETRKLESETSNARRQLRFQKFSSISAFLVAGISLLTLLATVYIQSRQLDVTRQQQEDTAWRDLLSSLQESAKKFSSDVTIAPRLKSFFESPRHSKQARAVAIQLMGQLTNEEGFLDLFRTVIAPLDPRDQLSAAIQIARSLTHTRVTISSACNIASTPYQDEIAQIEKEKQRDISLGICSSHISDRDVLKMIKASPDPNRILEPRRAYTSISNEQDFISTQLASMIQSRQKSNPTVEIDLSDIMFTEGDFSKIDFSYFDLSRTVFHFVKVDGAILKPRRSTGVDFTAAAWWKVAQINQNILKFLMEESYPYYQTRMNYPDGDVPTKDYYSERIAKLCESKEDFCKRAQFREETLNIEIQ